MILFFSCFIILGKADGLRGFSFAFKLYSHFSLFVIWTLNKLRKRNLTFRNTFYLFPNTHCLTYQGLSAIMKVQRILGKILTTTCWKLIPFTPALFKNPPRTNQPGRVFRCFCINFPSKSPFKQVGAVRNSLALIFFSREKPALSIAFPVILICI